MPATAPTPIFEARIRRLEREAFRKVGGRREDWPRPPDDPLVDRLEAASHVARTEQFSALDHARLVAAQVTRAHEVTADLEERVYALEAVNAERNEHPR